VQLKLSIKAQISCASMSSSAKESNNRYKSRLLNFFNRQAIQVSDRLGTTFRNVKVATEWGLQIVLYPIYLMVQAGLSVGKQLGHKIEQSPLLTGSEDSDLTQEEALETLTADRPIERVLKAIDRTNTQFSERTDIAVDARTNNTEILGVASLLETKNLVSIDRNNQILDVFDSQQQEQLKKSITWEVANYYRDRRLLIESQQQFPDRPIDNNSNNILPPVRVFWQTMDWVQQSPVAMAIDLFGESKLPLRYPNVRDLHLDSSGELQLQPTGFLATVDNTIADLETKQLLSSTELIDRLGNNWQKIIHKSPIDLKSNSEITNSKRSKDLLLTTTNSIELVSENSQNLTDRQKKDLDPFQIQILIRAAIDYFFGRQGERIQLKETIVGERLTNNNQQQNHLNSRRENPVLLGVDDSESERLRYRAAFGSNIKEEDPWLSWEDLFENSVSTESLPKNPPNTYRDRVRVRGELRLSPRELPLSEGELPFAPTYIKPQKPLTGSLNLSHQQDRKNILKVDLSQNNSLIKTKKKSTEIIINSQDSDSLSSYHYSSSELSNEVQKDTWEVKSTPVGYEKHSLEIILELLDRAILLLENIFVFIWRKLKRLFR
jgi:hypothetical protein